MGKVKPHKIRPPHMLRASSNETHQFTVAGTVWFQEGCTATTGSAFGISKPLLGTAGFQARGLWDHTSPANSSFHLLPPFSHTLTHMPSTELNLIVKLSGFQDQMLSKEEQTGSSEGWDVRGPKDFTFKATVKSSSLFSWRSHH